jgi:hypothetical protein
MEVKFALTESQMTKLAQAHKMGTAITLRLSSSKLSPTGIPLVLTATEYKKIQNGGAHNITLTAARVKKGGFLPGLLAALPTIASVIGGISGLTGIASNIKDMVGGKGCVCRAGRGKGFISDLNIPLISPLAKIIGLGAKKKRRGKGMYLAP